VALAIASVGVLGRDATFRMETMEQSTEKGLTPRPEVGVEASHTDMAELHGQLARELRNIIVGGETVLDKEGVPVRLSPSAGMLNVVRQFLKDNNIQTKPGKNKDMNALTDDLPFTD
jgi:hypothetical protein